MVEPGTSAAVGGYSHPYTCRECHSIIRSDDNAYAFDLEFEVDDDVRMENRSRNVVILLAPIWKTAGVVGAVGRSRVSTVRDAIKDQVDKFLVDYIKANPRK